MKFETNRNNVGIQYKFMKNFYSQFFEPSDRQQTAEGAWKWSALRRAGISDNVNALMDGILFLNDNIFVWYGSLMLW